MNENYKNIYTILDKLVKLDKEDRCCGLSWKIDFCNTSFNFIDTVTIEERKIYCLNDYFKDFTNFALPSDVINDNYIYILPVKKDSKNSTSKIFYGDFDFCYWVEDENGEYLFGNL